jgi:hypothetical protein
MLKCWPLPKGFVDPARDEVVADIVVGEAALGSAVIHALSGGA